MHYQTFDIPPHFLVSSLDQERPLGLSPQEEKLVNALWKQRKEAGHKLTNRKILSFVSFNGVQLIAERVPYKYYVAQEADAELKARLQIVPVCLSAVTQGDGAILVGRRSSAVFQFPGYFEAVPSGSLSAHLRKTGQINIQREILRELREETGIAKAKSITPRMLVHDAAAGLYEICLDLEIDSAARELLQPASDEYQQLQWVTKKELAEMLKREKWVPFSLFLLKTLL